MDMITYLMMAKLKKSKNQGRSNKNQNELMTVEPTSITHKDELKTIEAELINNQDELKTIEPESTATHKELVMTRPTSTTTQKELIEMNEHREIMTSQELQNKAGYVSITERFRLTTYATIVRRLEKYEEIKKNYSSGKGVLRIVVSLMGVLDRISRWFNLNGNNPKKQERKEVLEKLQQQISVHLSQLVRHPYVKERLDPELLDLLTQGDYYATSPTILFTYLMEKILSIYDLDEITPADLKTEMRNFLIADNDVIGATSLATQTSGGSAGVKIAFDFPVTLPCFKLDVEIDATGKASAIRLILSECQSERNNPNKFRRYCLMNMNGRVMEGKINGKLAIKLDPLSDFEAPSAEILEYASLNFIPKLEASASAAANANGVFLQVTEPKPKHFNRFKQIDDFIFSLVTAKNQSFKIELPYEATFFSLFSHAYGIQAEIAAEAGIGGAGQVGNEDVYLSYGGIFKAQLMAGVYGNAKFTNYTYQNFSSNRSDEIFKTQRTTMLFKQVYTAAEASGSIGSPIDTPTDYKKKTKQGQYDLINSLSYQSGFVYWEKETQKDDEIYKLSKKGLSGFACGHSLIAQQLNKYYQYTSADSEKKSRYLESLAKQLRIDSTLIRDFLDKKEHRGLILDILTFQQAGHFLEATFVAPDNLNFHLDPKSGQPHDDTFEQLEAQSKILQSLRFRTALQDGNTLNKPGFKFGLNIKVVKLGIDLGKVQEATSLKLTDYVIEWYDRNGRITNNAPNPYVPSSFLFL
ncbi:MAG: hypothetical protein QNJ37_15440 [Crocosphaera sp.]|nr:hypothetical protein [Crocosphaera sp.]